MRLSRKNLKKYPVKVKTVTEDEEANKVISYEPAGEIVANIQPMSGKVQAEIYGIKLAYMLTCYTQDELTEQNAVEVDNTDYKVVRVAKWSKHYRMDLERVT